jgi:hypothetical protein
MLRDSSFGRRKNPTRLRFNLLSIGRHSSFMLRDDIFEIFPTASNGEIIAVYHAENATLKHHASLILLKAALETNV